MNDVTEFFNSKNIVCDFRKPDVIRVAPNAFYNSFTDIYNFVDRIDKLSLSKKRGSDIRRMICNVRNKSKKRYLISGNIP